MMPEGWGSESCTLSYTMKTRTPRRLACGAFLFSSALLPFCRPLQRLWLKGTAEGQGGSLRAQLDLLLSS